MCEKYPFAAMSWALAVAAASSTVFSVTVPTLFWMRCVLVKVITSAGNTAAKKVVLLWRVIRLLTKKPSATNTSAKKNTSHEPRNTWGRYAFFAEGTKCLCNVSATEFIHKV
jgi:hypothetical protein